MSSLLSSYRPTSKLTGSSECSILTYAERGADIPVPFIYDNRTSTLDIDFTSGFTKYTNVENDQKNKYKYQSFGSVYFVEQIGVNFTEWIEAAYDADPESIMIREKPIIIPVNMTITQKKKNNTLKPTLKPNTDTEPPKTYQTILFKTKLVLQFTTGNGLRKEYLTFVTQLE